LPHGRYDSSFSRDKGGYVSRAKDPGHLAKFGGETVIDIMRTHPMVIIGGILHQNPFFVSPNEFLREFRERRGKRTTSRSTAA
jgi:hypothetical protein